MNPNLSFLANKSFQACDYYPYGEPSGQRYLFSGKEREHAAGRNTYDFGASTYAPDEARFWQPSQ